MEKKFSFSIKNIIQCSLFLSNKKSSENQTAAKLADVQGLQYFLQGKEEVFSTKRKEQLSSVT